MKKESRFKLALISMLYNPNVVLIDMNVANDLETIPLDTFAGYLTRTPNGISHYQITIYNPKNDGRKKSKK